MSARLTPKSKLTRAPHRDSTIHQNVTYRVTQRVWEGDKMKANWMTWNLESRANIATSGNRDRWSWCVRWRARWSIISSSSSQRWEQERGCVTDKSIDDEVCFCAPISLAFDRRAVGVVTQKLLLPSEFWKCQQQLRTTSLPPFVVN